MLCLEHQNGFGSEQVTQCGKGSLSKQQDLVCIPM